MPLPKAQLKVLEIALKVYPTAHDAQLAIANETPENLKAFAAELEAVLTAERVCLSLRKKGIQIPFADMMAQTGFSFPLAVTTHIESRIAAALRPD